VEFGVNFDIYQTEAEAGKQQFITQFQVEVVLFQSKFYVIYVSLMEIYMMNFSQPFTPAAKSHMEAQLSLFTDLSKKLFTSAQKVNELNIQVAQTLLEESVNSAHQLMAAEDPSEFLSIAAAQAQPAAEKVRAYQQHLTSIAAGTQVDMAKAAETHIPETTRTAAALAEEVARKASEETEKVTQRQKETMERLANAQPYSTKPGGQQPQAARKNP
jgi:phasin family protein